MREKFTRRLGVFFVGMMLLTGTPQKSEAMVIMGVYAITISETSQEIWAASGVIAFGLAVGYVFGNPIALLLDAPRDVQQSELSLALAKHFSFVNDQEVHLGFAHILEQKFDENTAKGINVPVGLSDGEIESVLSQSSQIFTEAELVKIKRGLQ